MRVPLWIDAILFRICMDLNRKTTVRWAGKIVRRVAARDPELSGSDAMRVLADRLEGKRPWPDKHWRSR